VGVESERFLPEEATPPWIRAEHMARFAFASKFVKGATVLDCACGSGVGSRLFSDSQAKKVIALDLSDAALISAADRCAGSRVMLARADAMALPIRDESVDVVVSFETFEHLPEPERFLDESRRVLVPGGLLVCSTPNRTVYSPGHGPRSIPWNRYHTREYSDAEFVAALARRFRNCQHFGQNPIGLRRARVMTALGRTLPGNTGVRLNQATKLTRFISHDPERYRVESLRPDRAYEISIAVCER